MTSGSYILSGQDIALLFARKLAAGSGAYALDGQEVNFSLIFLVLVGAAAGSYYIIVSGITSLGQTVKGRVAIEVY